MERVTNANRPNGSLPASARSGANLSASARLSSRAGARGFALLITIFITFISQVAFTATVSNAGPIVVALRAAAWAAPAAVELVMPSADVMDAEFADIERYANSTGSIPPGGSDGTTGGGGGGGGQRYQSPSGAKKGGKAGAIFGLLASLASIGAIEMDFGFGANADEGYADPAGGSTVQPAYVHPSILSCGFAVDACASDSFDGSGYGFGDLPGYEIVLRTATSSVVNGQTVNRILQDSYYGFSYQIFTGGDTPTLLTNGTTTRADFELSSTSGITGFRMTAYGMNGPCGYAFVWGTTPGCPASEPAAPTVAPGTTPVTATGSSICRNSSTGATRTVAGPPSTPYRYSDGGGRIIYPSCDTGETRTGIATSAVTDDGTSVKTPIPSTLQAPIIPESYAECQPSGVCELVLTRHANGQQVASTATNVEPFAQWQTVTSPNTGAGTRTVTETDGSTVNEPRRAYPDGSTLECRFGPYLVPYAQCESIPTEPIDTPTATPGGRCSLDFSWNPVSWVLEPVKCALSWAFVPSPDAMNGWKSHIDIIKGRGPFPFIDGILGWFGSVFDSADNASACTADSGVGPIRWCQAIAEAGDWAEGENGGVWGPRLVTLTKVIVTMYFAFYWVNRLTASLGGKSAT